VPRFLDLFAEVVRAKRDRLKRALKGEGGTAVDRLLQEAFLEVWLELPQGKEHGTSRRIVAVDSGRAVKEYANGAFLYICRAIAVTSWGGNYREVATDSFAVSGPREQRGNLVGLRSEHCEHQVALKALEEAEGTVEVVLLDGSLFGRAMHIPAVFDYPGEADLYLRYMEVFSRLLQECRKRKVLLVGVSKDSLASHLTKLLLGGVRRRLLEELSPHLSASQLELLREELGQVRERRYPITRLVGDLPLTDGQRRDLWSLVVELRSPRPDFALVEAWAETAGYTLPVELYPDVPLFTYEAKSFAKDPGKYVTRRFDGAMAEWEGGDEDFRDWAVEVMDRVFHFPAFITTCVKLGPRDTPMRVEVPAFCLGRKTRVSDLSASRILNPPPRGMNELLQMLRESYGGPDLYNVWLVKADQEARLPERDVRALYEPLVERELKITLRPTRRERRVRYRR